MPDQLTPAVANAILSAADLNDNWDMIEEGMLGLGPYILTGLVPSAGTGLSVDVTAGTASIGMVVTKASGFSIGSLGDGAVNHLYLLRDGTTDHNTTGTQPSESVKLGIATTSGGLVTSVDTTPASGRQAKVDLTTVVAASNANLFTAAQTLRLTDASGSAVSRPLILQHANSGGVGAINIGAGIEFQIETATEGLIEGVGRIDAKATAVTAGAVTGAFEVRVPNAGSMTLAMTVGPTAVTLGSGVQMNTNGGSLVSGAASFSGAISGSGTTSFSWKRFSLTFPSDADYTLLTGEADAVVIDVQSGVITATRNIVVPNTGSAFYIVINRNAQSVTLKTAAGTGITVASTRAAGIYFPTGVNAFRLWGDTNYTV